MPNGGYMGFENGSTNIFDYRMCNSHVCMCVCTFLYVKVGQYLIVCFLFFVLHKGLNEFYFDMYQTFFYEKD